MSFEDKIAERARRDMDLLYRSAVTIAGLPVEEILGALKVAAPNAWDARTRAIAKILHAAVALKRAVEEVQPLVVAEIVAAARKEK